MTGEARQPDSPAAAMKVFISYSRRDLAFASELKLALEDRGYVALVDHEEIDPNDKWKVQLGRLIFSCDKSFVECGKYLAEEEQTLVRDTLNQARQAAAMSEAEQKVYALIVQRFIAVFYPAAIYLITTRLTTVEGETFRTEGKVL